MATKAGRAVLASLCLDNLLTLPGADGKGAVPASSEP
jgi:hypothetical protein